MPCASLELTDQRIDAEPDWEAQPREGVQAGEAATCAHVQMAGVQKVAQHAYKQKDDLERHVGAPYGVVGTDVSELGLLRDEVNAYHHEAYGE